MNIRLEIAKKSSNFAPDPAGFVKIDKSSGGVNN